MEEYAESMAFIHPVELDALRVKALARVEAHTFRVRMSLTWTVTWMP